MVPTLDVATGLAVVGGPTTPPDLQASLVRIVTVARDTLPGVDQVGISTEHQDGGIETLATTGHVLVELDRLQREVGQGPCLQALGSDSHVRIEHADRDPRWPLFVPGAVAMGLRSQLVVRLRGDRQLRGCLTLHSSSRDTLPDGTDQLAELFAAHVALTLGHARQIDNLTAALQSRQDIGLALGLVMQRLDLDEVTAFAYLTRVSATTETKLRDVGAALVQQHQDRVRGAPTHSPSQANDASPTHD